MKKVLLALVAVWVLSLNFAACEEGTDQQSSQYNEITKRARGHRTYLPKNDVERNNYEAAQKLYDDPTTVIFCTAFPNNPTANAITVPIAGKLTSSTTSYFAPEHIDKGKERSHPILIPSKSVDGLYHPNPPQYRYGFTPGGQYVDFFNLPTLCTTQAYKFERQTVLVKVDSQLNQAGKKAEAALRQGNKAEAQRAIEAGVSP